MFYNLDVKIELISEEQDGDVTDIVFQLFFKNDQYEKFQNRSSASMLSLRQKKVKIDLPIKMEQFFELFPFHVVNFIINYSIIN